MSLLFKLSFYISLSIFFIGRFVCDPILYGQTIQPSSVWREAVINTGLVDSLSIVRMMRNEGLDFIENMEFDKAEQVLQKARRIASRLGNYKAMGGVDNNLAECYSVTGRHAMAVATYRQAFRLFEAIADTSAMAGILINLGDEYAKTGQIQKAAETELAAIRLKEESDDFSKLAFFYQKLGELYSATDPETWEYYIMKALALTRNPDHSTWYATIAVYNDLGAIWKKKGDYIRATAYYDTMFRLSQDAQYKKGISTAYSEKASMLYSQGKYSEALPFATQAYDIISESDDRYYLIYGATLKARILLKLNRPDEAIHLLLPAYALAKESSLLPDETEAGKQLSEAYQATGNWKEALKYHILYTSLKDSTDNVEVRNTLNHLRTRFETEKKQQLIDRLAEKNASQARQNRMLAGLLFISIAFVVLLILLFRFRLRSLRQGRAILQKEQEILSLESKRLQQELEYKTRELTSSALHLMNKNLMLADLKEKIASLGSGEENQASLIRQIGQNLNLDRDWQNFSLHFEEVHPDFFRRLKENYPDITPNEERLCAYLRINLSTKEISQMLNLTVAAVDKARNRLRKKLGIQPDINLGEFITTL